MNETKDRTPEIYATPVEWLEGKRRYVKMLRRLCGRRGEWTERRDRPEVDCEVLEAAMNWYEECHKSCVARTRAAGVILPIDEFVQEKGLDEVEREAIEILLVVATDLTSEDPYGDTTPAELVRLLARGRGDRAQNFLKYFLPGSKLYQILGEDEFWGWRLTGRVRLNANLLPRLLGLQKEVVAEAPRSGPGCWTGDIGQFLYDSGVVLDEVALESIRTAWGYLRCRKTICEKWGFGNLSHLAKGMCFIFHGPSGTGKTLTAKVLCRAMGTEPLIVSYPALLSAFVGDTPKNIKQVFTEAAQSNKVLVFDEADAVFTRRTEVRHSTDRYANTDVNTLLMELEQFPGVVILTTNHAELMDPALERRVRHKVYFGPPDTQARLEILRKHIPPAAPLAKDVDLAQLAEKYKLTGGQLANMVMTAAALAAARMSDDGEDGEITMADFEAAAKREQVGYAERGTDARIGF